MVRSIAAALAVSLVVFGGLRGRGSPPVAQACGIGVSYIEALAGGADVIVLADVRDAGGAANSLPPMTPQPTFTPSATPTTTPATPTRTPAMSIRVVTATPEPPRPTPTPFDLTGIGATLDIVRVYAGDARSPFSVDQEQRRDVERAVRLVESLPPGVVPPCEPGLGVYRFTPAARYLVFVDKDGNVPFGGEFRIEGADVILGDSSFRPEDRGYLAMKPDTYRRFFAGVDADLYEDEAQIRAPRVPLASVLRAIAFVRRDASIAPPDTGSAGLASGRW